MVGTRQCLELVWVMDDGGMDGATTGLQKQTGIALEQIDVRYEGSQNIETLLNEQEKHIDKPWLSCLAPWKTKRRVG